MNRCFNCGSTALETVPDTYGEPDITCLICGRLQNPTPPDDIDLTSLANMEAQARQGKNRALDNSYRVKARRLLEKQKWTPNPGREARRKKLIVP